MLVSRSLLAVALLGSTLSAQSPLCAGALAGTNYYGGGNASVLFNLTVTSPTGLVIDSFDLNVFGPAGVAGTVDMYVTAVGGTYLGNEANPAVWMGPVASVPVTSAGSNVATVMDLVPNLVLPPGTYGVGLHHAAGIQPLYVAPVPAMQLTYSNTDASIVGGSVIAGSPAAPAGTIANRVFNGCVHYTIATGGTIADFIADKVNVGPNDPIQFTDASIPAVGQTIVGWSWDFDNDGTPDSTVQNPLFPGYTGCGAQTVSLTVVDSTAATDTETKNSYVTVGAPVAAFDVMLTPSGPGLWLAQATDMSTGAPTAWSWDFDEDGLADDTTSTPGPWPYVTPGNKAITLTVTNACGMDTHTETVCVADAELCTSFVSNNGGNPGGAVYFNANVTNPAGLTVWAIDVNSDAGGSTPITVQVWCKRGTHIGFEAVASAWNRVAIGTGLSAGLDQRTRLVLDRAFSLPQGTTGIALEITGDGHSYSGTNANTTRMMFSDANLTLDVGSAANAVFSASLFSPRYASVCVCYSIGIDAGEWTQYGAGCTNSSGSIANLTLTDGTNPLATPKTNTPIRFVVTGGPASANSALHISFAPVNPAVPLNLIGAPAGCLYHADATVSLAFTTGPAGTGQTPQFTVPHGAQGINFFTQVMFADLALFPGVPLPVTTSNAYQGRAQAQ